MPQQDELAKFKQILSKLPEDKRKLLYKRLHSLPSSEREAYIADFNKKYYTEKKKPAQKKNTAQSVILGLLAALFIIGAFYFIYVFNKDKIDSKFNEMLGMPPEETIDTSPESNSIMGPEPRNFPTDTPTPVPATPTPSPVPLSDDHPDLSGLVIVIDPGHQAEPDTTLEESIPGTTAEKERATAGATGVNSGAKEYEITLKYALMMKEYLEGCGAEVILTRTENDINISNIERAEIAVENDADYFLRIHADSAPDSDISGVKVYVPSTGKYSSSAESEGEKLADAVAEAIGSTSLGAVQSNMYTGLNHADSVRSYQLVIGYLSNSDDDALINQEETAYKVAVAVADFLG
ncbi:MAG: N-acetylmuramoyl-L-alanine amidase [Saccharofermentans sp.]|nr:N-acetylmuramoyl-L-alanine amidase [Saccharofermentans sp.]